MGWKSNISWGYATHLATNPTLATYTNDTGSAKIIKSFYMYLATGKGFFNEGTAVTGDGSAISFYVTINGVKSSTATVTAISTPKQSSSTGNYYADKTNCTKTTVTFTNGIEVAAGASVSVIGTYNENLTHAGDGNTGQVLVAQKDDEYFGGEVVDAVKYYTVSYKANGGTGGPTSQTKTGGTPLTLTSDTPSRTGYTFKYWNTNSAGTGTTYYPKDSYSIDANITLYAIWEINSYSVSFNANGGTGDVPDTETHKFNSSFVISEYVPDYEGKAFQGWCEDKNGSGTKYMPDDTYTISKDYNVTLYAIWESGKYTVTFDLRGGTRTGGGATVQTIDSGKSATPPTVTKQGKTFQGWLGDYTNVTSSRTIVALWDIAPLWIYRNGKWEQFK